VSRIQAIAYADRCMADGRRWFRRYAALARDAFTIAAGRYRAAGLSIMARKAERMARKCKAVK
jgi:hypothetical protein